MKISKVSTTTTSTTTRSAPAPITTSAPAPITTMPKITTYLSILGLSAFNSAT